MIDAALSAAIAALARRGGMGEVLDRLPLPGGGNNRVYRLETTNGPALLKAYFRHESDPRDRLGTEYGFVSFAWKQGIRGVPQPLAFNRGHALGLYEFIDGQRPENADQAVLLQLLDFFVAVNGFKNTDDAASLPIASEACFCLADHLEAVEKRVRRVPSMADASPLDRAVRQFVESTVLPGWHAVRAWVEREAHRSASNMALEITRAERCLSPSDFGLHNALRLPDGTLRFVDFEYAGWDDPAKMVCDVFHHPAVPMPREHVSTFIDAVGAGVERPDAARRRIELLWPVYGIKWVFILLNEFLPVGGQRRGFAQPSLALQERKEAQYDKARRAFAGLTIHGGAACHSSIS